ncbi:hypothetical protein ZWY2020_022870 [Hordeum vulgare]|nr:hypothetical protein ZWY2020_022870 [Hordeum vulgare]
MRLSNKLLLLAIVLVLLPSEMYTSRVVAMEDGLFTTDYSPSTCSRIIRFGTCDYDGCRDDCNMKLNGIGKCVAKGCLCSFYCGPPLSPIKTTWK